MDGTSQVFLDMAIFTDSDFRVTKRVIAMIVVDVYYVATEIYLKIFAYQKVIHFFHCT